MNSYKNMFFIQEIPPNMWVPVATSQQNHLWNHIEMVERVIYPVLKVKMCMLYGIGVWGCSSNLVTILGEG